MKPYTPAGIREIQDQFGFRLTKSLGQNFLVDQNIRDKIVEGSLVGPDDLVVEIGPGAGVLTQALAREGAQVLAIEIDGRLIPVLRETLREYPKVEVLHEDIMKCDLKALILQRQPKGAVRIVGNLPYYITTPIIMKILEEKVPAQSLTVMVQKEVAARLAAKAGTKDYGAITLSVGYRCKVTTVTAVPREVFFPMPQVDSAVIRLDFLEEPPVKLSEEKLFFELVRTSFAQRRKTLNNTLNGIRGLDKESVRRLLEAVDIDPKRRGETLDIQEFARLANKIYEELNP